MTEATLSDQVKRVIIKVLGLGLDPEQLPDHTPLYSTIIRLDSLTLLLLITELEKEFSCQIDDEAVMMTDLLDVSSIVTLVSAQLQRAETGS